jgi:hypothetical protein
LSRKDDDGRVAKLRRDGYWLMRGPEDENVDTPALTLLGQGGWHRRLALFILPRLQRGPTVADEPNETILTMLRALDAKVDRLAGDVEVVKGKIDAWPDLNFLQAVAHRQLSEAREAREFRRYVENKLDEIYGRGPVAGGFAMTSAAISL